MQHVCGSPACPDVAVPLRPADSRSGADVPVRSAESPIALPSPLPSASAPAKTDRSPPGLPVLTDTSARYPSCLASTLRPGFGRRCLLARASFPLASSLDFLQGTFEKIYLHRLVRQQPLQLVHFLAECGFA